jgi:hypothetical protein
MAETHIEPIVCEEDRCSNDNKLGNKEDKGSNTVDGSNTEHIAKQQHERSTGSCGKHRRADELTDYDNNKRKFRIPENVTKVRTPN